MTADDIALMTSNARGETISKQGAAISKSPFILGRRLGRRRSLVKKAEAYHVLAAPQSGALPVKFSCVRGLISAIDYFVTGPSGSTIL